MEGSSERLAELSAFIYRNEMFFAMIGSYLVGRFPTEWLGFLILFLVVGARLIHAKN